jgi:ribosomal protein S18 acetylase RimI-like enzyme
VAGPRSDVPPRSGGEPLGLVSGIRDVQHSSVALLMAMWVHPDLPGTGAADALMSAVKAWAGEVRGAQIRLRVVENNQRARRFYERSGFCDTGRRGVIEKNGDVEIEMSGKVSV